MKLKVKDLFKKLKDSFKIQKKEKIFNRIPKEDLNYLIDFLKEKNLEYMVNINIDDILLLTINTKGVKTKSATKVIKKNEKEDWFLPFFNINM